ncbi:hypothetical protein [Lentzea cavernae]|uniref:Peptidase inhibitor family I36 n=1 Tax=Lentzea cavernae TaxID=2020703 RepID=A0ABQ3MHZ9_9PSEU|nr:hypothetical protein [Lentzea cavernae]GHH42970.1 hypothetical protein GCM10017774_40200 [Lentzea cavernae]
MRRTVTRVLPALALLGALGSFAPAQAEGGPVHAAAGCRAAPYSASFSLYFETESYIDLGAYITSSQCNDINLRSTNGTSYRACVIFVNHTSACNYETSVPAGGSWVNIATDVKDGTRFNVRIFKGGGNYVTRAGVMDF